MELTDYLRILRAHWLGVLTITALAVAGAAIFSLQQPKVYAANANGFVSTGASDNAALGSVSDTLAKSRATSYVDIAKSRATAEDVIKSLGLSSSPQALIGKISVDQPEDTVLLKITARGSTPRAAQQLADAWVAALVKEVGSIEDPSNLQKPGTVRVVPVESAELPSTPVSPNIPRNLALALVLGLLLGFGYAVVRNRLDRRLRTVSDVQERCQANVIGAIPATGDLNHKPGERVTISVDDGFGGSDHGGSEAFRKLRTNLRFMSVDSPPKVIVVTSPKPGDGKSTISANLAVAIAASGERTVLVDADLRRPSQASAFGLVGSAGLTDVLTGMVIVEEVLQRVAEHPNLGLLASGSLPPNPSELLGSRAMRHVLKELSSVATVIIDAPPLLPVADAAILTAVADGAFVVISAGTTLDSELDAALDQLGAVNGQTLGVILNRVPRRAANTGYYGSDYYSSHPVPEAETRSARRRAHAN